MNQIVEFRSDKYLATMTNCCRCFSPYGTLEIAPDVVEGIRNPRPDWGEDDEGRSGWCHECWHEAWMET